MTVVALTALALVLVGAVVSARAPRVRPWADDPLPGQAWLGFGLIWAGLLAAVVVVRHGIRGAHERGRRLAIAAILIGGFAATPLLFEFWSRARGW